MVSAIFKSSFAADLSHSLLKNGKVMIYAVTATVARRQLWTLVESLIGKQTRTVLEITFPYASYKTIEAVKQVFKEGKFDPVLEEIFISQEEFIRSVTVMAGSSPREIFILHAGHYLKKISLKSFCSMVGSISQCSMGNVLYVAMVPIMAPSVSPLTSTSGRIALRGSAAAAQGVITYLRSGSKKIEEVELDDFRQMPDEEEYVFVDPIMEIE